MNRAAALEQYGSSSEDEAAMDCVDQAHVHMSLLGPGRRASAARALLAFLGAAKGSLYSVNSLVEEVFKCYRYILPQKSGREAGETCKHGRI